MDERELFYKQADSEAQKIGAAHATQEEFSSDENDAIREQHKKMKQVIASQNQENKKMWGYIRGSSDPRVQKQRFIELVKSGKIQP